MILDKIFKYNIENNNIENNNIESNNINPYDPNIVNDNINPSGSINFSKFKDSYLILNLEKVENDSCVNIYAITYNILVITNGIGGLQYTK